MILPLKASPPASRQEAVNQLDVAKVRVEQTDPQQNPQVAENTPGQKGENNQKGTFVARVRHTADLRVSDMAT